MRGSRIGRAAPCARAFCRSCSPPLWPEGVSFRALAPDPRAGRQVAILPDDARGMVIAEAYAKPGDKPVLRREFTLAKPAKRR